MLALTARRYHILKYIDRRIIADGHAPHLSEIAAEFGIKSATADQHLKLLEKHGYIKRELWKPQKTTIIHLPGRAA